MDYDKALANEAISHLMQGFALFVQAVSQPAEQEVNEKELFTTKETLEFCAIGKSTLQKHVSNGDISYIKLGRQNRYTRTSVVELARRISSGDL